MQERRRNNPDKWQMKDGIGAGSLEIGDCRGDRRGSRNRGIPRQVHANQLDIYVSELRRGIEQNWTTNRLRHAASQTNGRSCCSGVQEEAGVCLHSVLSTLLSLMCFRGQSGDSLINGSHKYFHKYPDFSPYSFLYNPLGLGRSGNYI